MRNILNLISLLIAFTLMSCSTVNHTTKPVDLVLDSVVPPNTDNGSHKHFLVISKFTGFSKTTEEKLKKAVLKVDEVFNSQCFEDFMVGRPKLHSTNNRTPKEVVSHLRTSQATVELIYYYKRWSKVAGYTYPSVDWIKLNGKYHTGTTVCSEASNLGHEGSHKVGYGHSYKSNVNRPYSVPYSINAAMEVCCVN